MLSFQNNTPALLLPGFSLSHGHESTDLYLQGSITDQGLSCCTLNPLLWMYRLHISFSRPMAGLWQQTSSWRPNTALTANFGLKTAWQFWRILLGLLCGLGHFHQPFSPPSLRARLTSQGEGSPSLVWPSPQFLSELIPLPNSHIVNLMLESDFKRS